MSQARRPPSRPPRRIQAGPRRSGPPPVLFIGIGAIAVVAIVGGLFAGGWFGGSKTAALASPVPSSAGSGSASPVASEGQSTSSGGPTASPSPLPSPSLEPVSGPVPVALVAPVTEPRIGVSVASLQASFDKKAVAITCGLGSIDLAGAAISFDEATCLEPDALVSLVSAKAGRLGLLPAALVTPAVKVLEVGGADLFGGPKVRAVAYPLEASADSGPAAWTAFDPADVRTLISTGDTCPDRGVSLQTVVKGKGWDWALGGGTAKYTGVRMDTRFSGPAGKGWPVVQAKRTGNEGAVRALISDAEITLDDFECPMTKRWVHHPHGTVFSIDPKVAGMLARSGIDVVTLASNHLTDQGISALRETMQYFDDAGIEHFGAGDDLAEALQPAVIEVRGVRFAFVGLNEIPGSAKAGPSKPGVAYIGTSNIRTAVANARKVADVVIMVPQWGWPEYHNDFTKRQRDQMAAFFAAGADHVIGHGTHWAAAISLTEGERGPRFVISSHGNFLFGQDWSRQTQEGVVVELTFVGTQLAQARLHPYIMLDQAQANLVDPATDGEHVLDQVWSVSDLLSG